MFSGIYIRYIPLHFNYNREIYVLALGILSNETITYTFLIIGQ